MNFALTRNLIIFGLVLPLAALVGFLLATPLEFKTFFVIGLVTCTLLIPIMLRWYHPVLVFTLNAWVNVFFLPGKPQLWMLCAAVGFGVAILNRAMTAEKTFIHVPALTYPLLFFLGVVLLTAKLTGGLGIRSLGGSSFGGKGYYYIIFAILAYFVLTSKVVPAESVTRYISGYCLSGITAVFSNLAFMLGPAFYFLYYLFPVDFALSQAMADWSPGLEIMRLTGLATAAAAVYFFLLAKFGVRGILQLRKPLRWLGVLLSVLVSTVGGFRSLLVIYALHFGFQFYLERLVRTRLCVLLVSGGIAAAAAVLPFAHKMPLSVQRCVSFIPGVSVSAFAKADAEASTRWRLEMWQVLLPEIPKYLIVGKGYALDPSALYLANQAALRGLARSHELAIIAGNYHNGPLSVIIPFGIFGVIGFLWLMGAGWWVLYRNFRFGDPYLQSVNTFLLAYFLMRLVMFIFVFGAADVELIRFTGMFGFSVALNRGVRKPADRPVLQAAELAVQPAAA